MPGKRPSISGTRINGKPPPFTLGRVGQITLQKARQDAEQLIGEMRGGSDPVERKRDQTAGGITLRRGVGADQGGDEEKEPVTGHV